MHFHQLFERSRNIFLCHAPKGRRNGFVTAMWVDILPQHNWRGAQIFANVCSILYSMAAGSYMRKHRHGRACCRKKKAVGNVKHAILSNFSQHITNVLIWACICTKQSLWTLMWSIVSHPRIANSCQRNDDDAMQLSIFFDGKKHHIVLCLASNTFSQATFSQATLATSFEQLLYCISDAAIVC